MFLGLAVLGFYLGYGVLIIAGLIGWVFNLVGVVHLAMANAPLTTLFVVRIIGIFAFPLGGVLGYF